MQSWQLPFIINSHTAMHKSITASIINGRNLGDWNTGFKKFIISHAFIFDKSATDIITRLNIKGNNVTENDHLL